MQGAIKNPEKFPFVIIGNKADKEDERKVDKQRIENWCQNNGGCPYFETSARDNTRVGDAFEKITQEASKMVVDEDIYVPPSIKLKKKEVQTKPGKQGCDC